MILPKTTNNFANEKNNSVKEKKLIQFSNWPKWSIFIKLMLIKKDV